MEIGEWNFGRIVRDVVILKENLVRFKGCYYRWIRREFKIVKGIKYGKNDIEIRRKVKI